MPYIVTMAPKTEAIRITIRLPRGDVDVIDRIAYEKRSTRSQVVKEFAIGGIYSKKPECKI